MTTLTIGDALTITGTATGTIEGTVVDICGKWNGYKVRWASDGQVDFLHQGDIEADVLVGRLAVNGKVVNPGSIG